MSKLQFNRKSWIYSSSNNEVEGTHVILTNAEGAFYPVLLPKEAIDLPVEELEKKALEVVYQDNFPDRAKKEQDEEIKKKFQEADKKEQEATLQRAELKELLELVTYIALGISGGLDINSYTALAQKIDAPVVGKRYTGPTFVTIDYPYDTNPKWQKGNRTIVKYTGMTGYNYTGQSAEDMLKSGAWTIVLPNISN
jgi:hypothetical protein